jgi:hypothetical protein
MVIKKPFKQLPRSVSWRWAAAEIARCLGDEALAEAFRSTKDDLCTNQEWFAMEYLQATRPIPQKVDAEGSCACGHIVLFREPIVSMKELEDLDAANPGHRRSPADLGFSKRSQPAGCVSYWLMCVGHYAYGSHRMTRPGRSGRPGSELQLRGALRVLVSKIDTARSALDVKNVVSPATCVALLLFFEVFAGGSRGRNPALPRIVQRNGVATAASLRALAHKIDDLSRER